MTFARIGWAPLGTLHESVTPSRVEPDVMTRCRSRTSARWPRRAPAKDDRTSRAGPATSRRRHQAPRRNPRSARAASGQHEGGAPLLREPASRTRRSAPITAITSLTDASNDSPIWNRGNWSRSKSVTVCPFRASPRPPPIRRAAPTTHVAVRHLFHFLHPRQDGPRHRLSPCRSRTPRHMTLRPSRAASPDNGRDVLAKLVGEASD